MCYVAQVSGIEGCSARSSLSCLLLLTYQLAPKLGQNHAHTNALKRTHTNTLTNTKASILNLLAIALDRYWAVTNVDYIYRRTRRRVNIMILCAWTVGAIVSLAPIFGWKDPDFAKRVLIEHKCMVSQDVGYQIFATISTFYAPLVLLLALYWRIFQVSWRLQTVSLPDQVGLCLSSGWLAADESQDWRPSSS